jgi:hypothetical protein
MLGFGFEDSWGQGDDRNQPVGVRLVAAHDLVWLTQQQIADLF